LVDHPFEGAAIAEAVFVDLGRDAAEGEKAVVLQLCLVFRERHLLDAPV